MAEAGRKRLWQPHWNNEILKALEETGEYDYTSIIEKGLRVVWVRDKIRALCKQAHDGSVSLRWDKNSHVVYIRKTYVRPKPVIPKGTPAIEKYAEQAKAIRSNRDKFIALCEKDGDKYPINLYAVTERHARMDLAENYKVDKIIDILPAKDYRKKYIRPL
jgi:hypothetical protein